MLVRVDQLTKEAAAAGDDIAARCPLASAACTAGDVSLQEYTPGHFCACALCRGGSQ